MKPSAAAGNVTSCGYARPSSTLARLVLVGISVLSLSILRATEAEMPVYDGAQPWSLINRVAAQRVPLEGFALAQLLRLDVRDPEASSRSNRWLRSDEGFLGQPLPPQRALARVIETQPEDFFLLWDNEPQTETGVVIASFQVDCPVEGDWTLAVGCEYAFAVEVNGAVVHGRCGYARFGKASDLITCRFRAGRNQVTLLFVSSQPRLKGLYERPWTARVELFRSATEAVTKSVAWNRHPFDCPIVAGPERLRARLGAPYFKEAKLRHVDGTVLMTGAVRPDGSIAWEHVTDLPPVVIGEIDGVTGEPVLFGDVDRLSPLPVPQGPDADPVRAAWIFRYNHLVAPEFVSMHHTLAWADKVAYARASAERPGFFSEARSRYPGLQFGSFRSRLDGSSQYFQYFRPGKPANGTAMPLLVIVPGVTDPVRPFLENVTAAGFEEWERWCAVAAQHGFALLWPGYNDVDYGGEYARAQLSEAIAAYRSRFSDVGPLYLLGTCSASIATIRFAAEHPQDVAGAILFSPELRRGSGRVTPGIETEEMEYHFAPEGDEFVKALVPKLAGVRVGILFDSGMPGHGDRAVSDAFGEWLQAAGGSVHRFVAPEAQEYVWGERMVWRLESFFAWMRDGAAPPRKTESVLPTAAGANHDTSVKHAVLGGFSVDAASFGADDPWLHTWATDYRQWRSVDLPFDAAPETTCRVTATSLDEAADTSPRLKELLPRVAGRPAFALVLQRSGGASRILKATNTARADYYPRIDPLLDGYFTGTLWVLEADRWEPLATWQE